MIVWVVSKWDDGGDRLGIHIPDEVLGIYKDYDMAYKKYYEFKHDRTISEWNIETGKKVPIFKGEV